MRTPPLDPSALAPTAEPLAGPHRNRVRPRQTFLQVLETPDERAARPSQGLSPAPTLPARLVGAADPTMGAGLRALVTRTLRAEDQLDRSIAAAAAGKTFSAGQLLALQATAFRYSQTVEVLSRAADRLVGSIKQTLGTQV